jgi:D-3-phosphoglycerate dehydrogenase
VLLTAPYMNPTAERFRPIMAHYGIKLIIPVVHERFSDEEILVYAGQFDGTICGDDRYTECFYPTGLGQRHRVYAFVRAPPAVDG